MKKFSLFLITSFVFLACAKNSDTVTKPGNNPPIIDSVSVSFDLLQLVPVADFTCYARDPDGDSLTYKWSASSGEFSGKGRTVKYIIPPCCDSIWNRVTVEVFDPYQAKASYTFKIKAPK
ncbi:MAG: hypothetical protein CH6_2937 [Candidatus Kapaibacterium sp.]|nr:MAG: hypothetical protein CH6_2937 [Candidatus Kapabacteria bacterium]